jgi:plastocyanin
VFRRIALIVALVALLITPTPVAAATTIVNINGAQNAFVPSTTTVMFNDSVQWKNNSATRDHTSSSDLFNLWSEPLPAGSQSDAILFPRAGTFAYHCDFHPTMRGSIKVTMSISDTAPMVGQQVTIDFASLAAPSGFTEQIQKRKAGGTWKLWQTSAGTSVTWTPQKAKTFQFRARFRRISDGMSTPYSPVLQVTVSPT